MVKLLVRSTTVLLRHAARMSQESSAPLMLGAYSLSWAAFEHDIHVVGRGAD